MSRTFCFIAILCLALVNTISAQVNTWTGANSSDWSDGGNWSLGVPTNAHHVVIPNTVNDPSIQALGSYFCDSLTVNSGGSLVIEVGAVLTVSSYIMLNDSFSVESSAFVSSGSGLNVNNGGVLVIKNDGFLRVDGDVNVSSGGAVAIQDNGALSLNSATGVFNLYGGMEMVNNGMFYQKAGSSFNNSGGSFSLSRTGTGDPDKFNMWSSPVSSQSIAVLGGGAYSFDPASSTTSISDDTFDPGWKVASGTMSVGVGYAATGAGTVTFTGTPNNGVYNIAVQYNNPDSATGVPYNLLGNPYPSPISISNFLSTNSADLATLSVYLWDNPNSLNFQISDYAVVNSIGSVTNGNGAYSNVTNIASGQGFMIEVDSLSDMQVTFNNQMRASDDNSEFFKNSIQRLWLSVIDQDSMAYNETLIGFVDDATDHFDKAYDAYKLKGNTSLSLYTINNNRYFAIQGYPTLKEDVDIEFSVPVGVLVDTSKSVIFSLKGAERLDNFWVFLDDSPSGILHNLTKHNYTVQLDSGEYNNRFKLVLVHKTLPVEVNEIDQTPVNIHYNEGTLVIDVKEHQSNVQLSVYDMGGKLCSKEDITNIGGTASYEFHASPGVYLVSVKVDGRAYRQKIYVPY